MHQIHYQYLRPKKADALRGLHETALELRQELRVWHGENAVILPVRKNDSFGWTGLGGVLDHHGNYVDLSATLPFVKIGYPVTEPVYRDEKVVYCGYLIRHWGHFLVDAVCRLWYFLKQDPTIDKYVFIVDENEEREVKGNYREFLELLGIWGKLELVNVPTSFREVIVPELSFRKQNYYSREYLAVFDAVAEHVRPLPDWKPHARIFLSRSQLKKDAQYEFGHEALDAFFAENSYTVLFPEQVSLSQMIYWIRNAEVVASASGSAPHNLLFGHQGQHLEILERCAVNNDYQASINRMKELNVTYIDANICLYTVAMCGPFIVGYTPMLERFAADRNMLPPQEEFRSEAYFRSCFTRYMKAYFDLYQHHWFIEDYLVPEMDYHMEAYQEGAEIFRDYLIGRKPFFWYHYLMPHYWKQFIKRLLGR